MDNGVRIQMIIDAPDDLYALQSPPGLKEALLHSPQTVREYKAGTCHQQGRYRLCL